MVSIIIPCFNQHEITIGCLEAIQANTQDYEIVIIDNGSDSPVEFTGVPGIIIRNKTNLGFPIAVNQGIGAAKGDIIILLNNDVIVTENWAERLKWHLLKYDIVGPLTNYCAGIQEITLPVYRDEKELNEQAIKWQLDHAFQSQEVNWIIGFCMAFKKSLYDELGSFDESLWPSSGEEINFCLKSRATGFQVGIAWDIYVHHHGSLTFKAMHEMKQLDYGEICKMTENHIAGKWGEFWTKQEIKGG